MSLRDDITKLVTETRELNAHIERKLNDIGEMEARIDRTLGERLEPFGVRIESSFSLNFRDKDWEPEIHVAEYEEYKDDEGTVTFLKVDGRWCWHKGFARLYSKVYPHNIIEDREPPFDVEALERTCQELQEELGIPVRIREYQLVTKVEYPETIDDLLVMYPGADILGQGNIWCVGWDVPDEWVALKDQDGGIHVFYDTSSHNEGFSNHLTEATGFQPFLDYIKREGTEAYIPDAILSLLTGTK